RPSRRRSARALRIEQPSAMRGRISIASTCLLLSVIPKIHHMLVVAPVCPIGDSARPIFGLGVLSLHGTKQASRSCSLNGRRVIRQRYPLSELHNTGRRTMKAIVVTDQAAGTAGMKLVERPEPQGASRASLSGANYGDCVVQVHASGFTGDELSWPSTWIDRLGRDRTPSIPGHELAGVVTALSYGTTGLSVGQRVFGLTDWTRDGTL